MVPEETTPGPDEWREIAGRILEEDLDGGVDLTSEALIGEGEYGRAKLVARRGCMVAGQPGATEVYRQLGEEVSYRVIVDEGSRAGDGQVIAKVEGPVSLILTGERNALNILNHLSGIATLTMSLVEVAAPYGVKIMDTRKTLPGLRSLEKYAVRLGGGVNHRHGLYDGVMVKDNHVEVVGGVNRAVDRAKRKLGDRFQVIAEVSTPDEVEEALEAGADVIMLDNMTPEQVEEAVDRIGGRCQVEVSGGITPDNIRSYLPLGIDRISLGWITHSAPAADIALDMES